MAIYKFKSYNVEQLEKRINSWLWNWLGLPKCLNNTALYANSNMLQLPSKRLIEEYKVVKVRTTIQFRFSKDPKISRAGIEVYTGKKWKTAKELKIAKEWLWENNNPCGSSYWLVQAWGFSPPSGSTRLQVKRNISYYKAKYTKVKRKTEWKKW